MTKRKNIYKKTKKHISKRSIKKMKKHLFTRKQKYGGEPSVEFKEKNAFRRSFNNIIIQISNKKNVNQALKMMTNLFQKNKLINTLIPVTQSGKPVDKETYSLAKKPVVIYDFVSPITVLFDNVSEILSNDDMLRLLQTYYINGGNFNNLSSRFKESPFDHEVDKKRDVNVKLLLNKSYPFHIIEEGLSDDTKNKLAELIPNEQQIYNEITDVTPVEHSSNTKLTLPYILPENESDGYETHVVPDFWKPIFQNGVELTDIKETFMGIYEKDKLINSTKKEICKILETIIPGYYVKEYLMDNETEETFVKTNILNCFITLLYGIVLYKLYDTNQEYLFMFKGGRALQLSLVDIPNIGTYFSDDTDILIIPNKIVNAVYDERKMENLSAHIAYLVKWMLPPELNVIVSLPSNSHNKNKEVTKLLYNKDKLYRPLSDIGFGVINEEITPYFESKSYFPMYVDQFETSALFITPTLDNMLAEKLYFYSKYFMLKQKLERNIPIDEEKYISLSIDDCKYLMFKFYRAILKLTEAIIKRDNATISDANSTLNIKSLSKSLTNHIIDEFKLYKSEEIENIVNNIYPPDSVISSSARKPLKISATPSKTKV